MTEAQYLESMEILEEFCKSLKDKGLKKDTLDDIEGALAKIQSNLVFEVMGLV